MNYYEKSIKNSEHYILINNDKYNYNIFNNWRMSMLSNLVRDVKNYGVILDKHGIKSLPWLYRYVSNDSPVLDHLEKYNDRRVVIPFLDALGLQYKLLSEGVIVVKGFSDVRGRLENLGFELTFGVADEFKNRIIFNHFFYRTEELYAVRLYNPSYEIELHIIPDERYDVLLSAIRVADKLNVKNYLDTLMGIYTGMLGFESDEEHP